MRFGPFRARLISGLRRSFAPLRRWRSLLGRRVIVVATGAAAAIPVINSTVKAVRAGWVPAGDDGIIATRGWDVLTSHTPLVGQYSEAGLVIHGQVMHSPGPMLYWLLALPARYGSVESLAVTMGIVNVLAIIGCVALARRRGGYSLMFASALGIALMCQSLPTESMHDIWNPAAGLFPFLLLVFVGWSLACGEYRLLPLSVLLASFVTQTHLMYLAPTAVVVAVSLVGLALGALARRKTHAERRRRAWPWVLAALLVAAACWTEPTIEEIRENPGNLTMIVRTVEHRGSTLGASIGWHALVRSVGERPWWLYVPASEWERKFDVRKIPTDAQEESAIAVLAALVLAGIGGALRRRWDLLAAAVIGLGMGGAMVLQVASNPSSKLLSETLGYTLWWGSELGLWVWLVLAWALWLAFAGGARAIAGRLQLGARLRVSERLHGHASAARLDASAVAALAAALGVAAVGSAVADTAKPDSHIYEYRPVAAMAQGIERFVPRAQSIDYRLGPLDVGTQPMEPALRFLLVRHGDRVLAQGSYPRLGSYYELDHHPYQWIVYLRDGKRREPHMTLAARVRFRDPWGTDILSAWVARAPRTAHSARHRRGGPKR
jgi:hypothetical protein